MTQHFIEPAARIITAIGRDLIKDIPASIVELVKNSYDADASCVNIIFTIEEGELLINISDDGHGMDKETIINTWLVPGTDHKLIKKKSPKKRPFQGRKGIGRYAVAVLGNKLELQSIQNGIKTIAKIDWTEFETARYLRDIKIPIESHQISMPNGTNLLIKGGKEYIELLTEKEMKNITRELRRLVSPIDNSIDDEFDIYIEYKNFYEDENKNQRTKIEPFPILELYNFRLTGTIDTTGKANLTYENAYSTPVEVINFTKQINLKNTQSYCGNIELDFKVFDKDDKGLELLISKLKHRGSEESINKTFVRKLLKESAGGVGIYRNGFRIRPHGDQGFDWLNLDNRRIQNPSQRIGMDQIAGFVMIESEELSYLEEKSARDGLRENKYYEGLKALILEALTEVEKKRFTYRRLKLKNLNNISATSKIESLFDFTEFNSDINNSLEESLIKIKDNPAKVDELAEEIKKNVSHKIRTLEKQKNTEFKQFKEIIAIYQGQATLGKIISVILHEGRKSLGWFSNQLPRTIKWLTKLGEEERIENPLFTKILDRLRKTEKESISLEKLFNKLDPLTAPRRSNPKNIDLTEIVNHIYEIFENELNYNRIAFNINVEENSKVYGIQEDFLMCMTNLVENSIYWLKQEKNPNRYITININQEDDISIIDILDNGPGIEQEYIENEAIFEPGFSGKSESSGTGLGLAIAGEAIERNNGELKAIYSDLGAHFRIEINHKKVRSSIE